MEALVVVLAVALVVTIGMLLVVVAGRGHGGSGGHRGAPTSSVPRGGTSTPGPQVDPPRTSHPSGTSPPAATAAGTAPTADTDLEARILRREDAAFIEGMVVGHYVWPAQPRDDDRERVDRRVDEPDRVFGDDDPAFHDHGYTVDDGALDDDLADDGLGFGFGMADDLGEGDDEDPDDPWDDGFDDPWGDGFDAEH